MPRSRSPRTPCRTIAQDFAYTTTGTGGGTFGTGFSLDDDADATLPNTLTFTFTGADATGTKTITETLPVTGWTLTNLVCSKGTTTLATGLASIALLPGDAVTCTYTNTQNASLDIEKQSVGGTATFDYTVTGTGLGALHPRHRGRQPDGQHTVRVHRPPARDQGRRGDARARLHAHRHRLHRQRRRDHHRHRQRRRLRPGCDRGLRPR